MKLTIIGCTGSMSGPDAPASCYLVQARGAGPDGGQWVFSLVLDMGSGSMGQLLNHVS